MQNTEAFVRLGRFMIMNAPMFADDALFNRWARVGQMLTEVGNPFAPRLAEFAQEDQAVARDAALVVAGKLAMPDMLRASTVEEPRRTRRPRMTKVMSKADRPVKAHKAAKVKAGEPKRRGRPPGSKNKLKTAAKTAAKRR